MGSLLIKVCLCFSSYLWNYCVHLGIVSLWVIPKVEMTLRFNRVVGGGREQEWGRNRMKCVMNEHLAIKKWMIIPHPLFFLCVCVSVWMYILMHKCVYAYVCVCMRVCYDACADTCGDKKKMLYFLPLLFFTLFSCYGVPHWTRSLLFKLELQTHVAMPSHYMGPGIWN